MGENKIICPVCGKDVTPRPGAILTCTEKQCPFWRILTQ
jgi:hypothetical protein